MSKLVLAEKPSCAKSIAAVLGASKKKDGFFEGGGYLVSWCYGHLLGLADAEAYDEKYKKWNIVDLPIIPQTWKYTPNLSSKKQLNNIRELFNRADVDGIICATDAGREGELIFRLVYNYCKSKKSTQRLWISSMEDSAIKKGFAELKNGREYDSLYAAAMCRQNADWLWGINNSRLYTKLYDVSLSVGRVQTPTLAMLVARNIEIKAFAKSAFYTPELDCGEFTASGEKNDNRETTETLRAACDGKSATVKSIERVEKAVLPPKLYDLLTLQREANRLYGFTAQQTQDCMQSLYEKKLATYPRTDSRYLTDDTAAILPELLRSLPFVDTSKISVNIPQLINAKEEHEHHALLPTLTAGTIDLASLPNAERSLLQMLCVRVAAAVGDKHIFAETTVKLDCEGNIFTAKGKTIVSEGFKEIEKSRKTDKTETDKSLPEIKEGQIFATVAATVKEGFTSSPKAYTDDTLLSAMETAGASEFDNAVTTRGIGTAATRSGIIEALIAKDYAKRDKRSIIPTEKGMNLITILPEELKSPKLTADWENKLNLVERGEMQEAEFMSGIVGMTQKIISNNRAPNPAFITLFPAKKRDSIGACPRCNKDVTENEKGFCCIDRSCGFAMWKANKFFTSKKKKLTADIAAELLKSGSVKLSGLHSENTGKSYDAIIGIDDSKSGFVNFKILEFINKGGRK